MNVSTVLNAYGGGVSKTERPSREGSGFSGIFERLKNSAAASAESSGSTERAAAESAGLDAETLAHLDKYAEIYNKFAEKYGDGFELKGKMYISGDAESEAEAQKYNQIRADFQNELSLAGIPGEYPDAPITVKEGAQFEGLAVAKGHLRGYNTGIDALFYAEKYGLAGLSREEMVKKVFAGMKTGTANEMAEAADRLYLAGAISGLDEIIIRTRTHLLAVTNLCGENPSAGEIKAALDTPMDWSGLLDALEDGESGESPLDLLIKAWQSQNGDGEGARLEALMRKIDDQQAAIREDIERRVQKLREQELMSRAVAESARLRAFLMPDSLSDAGAAGTALDMAASPLSSL